MKKRFAVVFVVLGMAMAGLLVASRARAQATASATLQGTLTDQSGGVIVGATVTLTNKDQGWTRTAATTGTGFYRFELLPPGIYSLKITQAGFATISVDHVELLVGQATTLDFTVTPGQISETVEVSTEAPLIDPQKTQVGLLITPSEVNDLPLNGRDFGNLAYLAPGARPVAPYDPTKQRVAVFAINGSNGRNVNVTVNGIDDKDNTVGGPVMQLPLMAVQEFNISTQRFSAANGRSEGAAVNVITKSGANRFHGDAYFFDTQTALNANDFFSNQSGQPTPQFERQQFGGDIGGPIIRDKDFFFFALERDREHTQIPVTAVAFTNLTLAKPIGAQPAQAIPTPYFDWRYTARVDHRFSSNNSAYLTYNAQTNTGLNDQSGQKNDLTAGNFTDNHLILANFTLNSVLNPRVVNNFTAGYQYWNNVIDTRKFSPFTINFPNSIYFGTNGNVPQESIQKKWQFRDDLSFIQGKHNFKTGVDFVWEPELGGFFEFNPVPALTFFDLPSVILNPDPLCGRPLCYPNGFSSPGAVISMSGAAGNPDFFLPNGAKMFGVYLQDDWKLRSNFTLNLGVRWDKDFDLFASSQIPNNRTYQALKAINSPFASRIPQDDNRGWSPRIGFAWDLAGKGKHIIRGGYGLYFGQTFQNIPLFMMQQANPVLFATVFSITYDPKDRSRCKPENCTVPGTNILLKDWRFGVDPNPVLPPPATSLKAGNIGRLMDPDYRNPYSEQWNVGYSFQLNAGNVIEVDYIHELGVHESNRLNINPINPATKEKERVLSAAFATAKLPVLGPIVDDQSNGRSRYDGLNVTYRRRMSRHVSLNASYVLSRGVGYDGNAASFANTPVNPFKPFDPAVDFGPVPNDERHRGVISGVVTLPWGFQVAPIMQVASARPWNPNFGPQDIFGFGARNSAVHAIVPVNEPTNYTFAVKLASDKITACLSAGTCIQLPFNAARGQTFFQLDTRVTKTVHFSEKTNLRLIFQGFNLTNHANFGNNFNSNIRTSSFGTPSNFIAGSGVIVPKSFRAEFGAEFRF